MGKYKSYDDAAKRGREDVWPGCGRVGACMPCGGIHNYDYRSYVDGPWVDDYQCSRNRNAGCPRPKPAPNHDLDKRGRCRRCGGGQ